MTKEYPKLERKLGYKFRSRDLLREALTHSSAKDEDHPSNERLEFLGDSVLGLAVTEFIFNTHPDLDEGELTAIKSIVVSSASLSKAAKEINIRPYLVVGKGIAKKRALPQSVIANALEAIIGAVYVDSGIRAAKKFVRTHFEPLTEKALKRRKSQNYKSRLQYYVQKKFGVTPHYKVLSTDGPDHQRTFTLAAVVGSRQFPPGKGKTKKDASQRAARAAMRLLQEEYGKIRNPGR
jgi:ribonuclease-3